MTNEDAAAVLAAMDVMHAVLDGDGERLGDLVEQHGPGQVILGLSRIACSLGQHQCGSLDGFRGFLHRWAVDLQLAELGQVPAGGEG